MFAPFRGAVLPKESVGLKSGRLLARGLGMDRGKFPGDRIGRLRASGVAPSKAGHLLLPPARIILVARGAPTDMGHPAKAYSPLVLMTFLPR